MRFRQKISHSIDTSTRYYHLNVPAQHSPSRRAHNLVQISERERSLDVLNYVMTRLAAGAPYVHHRMVETSITALNYRRLYTT